SDRRRARVHHGSHRRAHLRESRTAFGGVPHDLHVSADDRAGRCGTLVAVSAHRQFRHPERAAVPGGRSAESQPDRMAERSEHLTVLGCAARHLAHHLVHHARAGRRPADHAGRHHRGRAHRWGAVPDPAVQGDHSVAAPGDRRCTHRPRNRCGPGVRHHPHPDQRRPSGEHDHAESAHLSNLDAVWRHRFGECDGHHLPLRDARRGDDRGFGDLAAGRRAMNGIETRRLSTKVILWFLLATILVLYGFPFVYLLLTSFKTPSHAISVPPSVLPDVWTLENYVTALAKEGVVPALINSVVTAVLSTVLSLVLAVPAAYAVTRYRTPSGRVFVFAALITRMVPTI